MSAFHFSIIPYTLKFKFPAGTSRGVLHEKKSYFIKVTSEGKAGWGEVGPLPGLSLEEWIPEFDKVLKDTVEDLNQLKALPEASDIPYLISSKMPAVRFALETALLDLNNGGRRLIYDNDFYRHGKPVLINGLIWMGDKEDMLRQVRDKLEKGFQCIKLKIGAIDFAEEMKILEAIRAEFSPDKIELRVDVNGAFSPDEALDKLHELSRYNIHSIEQPIAAGQNEAMARICAESPIPVALDEELIGEKHYAAKSALLENIQPAYIILKPTLLGGFSTTDEWIKLAEKYDIGWWITSALESDIGLNAIAQYTYAKYSRMPQGLGTGTLFVNNIPSPLTVEGQYLRYDVATDWDLSVLN